MTKIIEILAPGGNIDSIKAAIAAGADAVYCGLDRFNARNRAENLSVDELIGVIRLAHKNNCQVFLTLNIILAESEFSVLFSLLNKIVNIGLDAVIVQDFGLLYLLKEKYKNLEVHASTQLTTHNGGQISFLNQLNVSRVNLCRELNLKEITYLSSIAHKHNMLTEIFVHGSQCICFSGICYMSSAQNGTSGNRGRCGQPCRKQYITTQQGKTYPLNLKDMSTFPDARELVESGADSIKIEGRIKKFHYVFSVVDSWKQQLRNLFENNTISKDDNALHILFNRGFSNGFLRGNIDKYMFIDNARDNSARRLAEQNNNLNKQGIEQAKKTIYNERTAIIRHVEKQIEHFKTDKVPVEIFISGKPSSKLKVSVKAGDISFEIFSDSILLKDKKSTIQPINHDQLFKTFKVVNSSGYQLSKLIVTDPDTEMYLPVEDFKSLQRKVSLTLSDLDEFTPPYNPPKVVKPKSAKIKPTLSVLLSSKYDLHLCDKTDADFYFQIPDCLGENYSELQNVLQNNPNITPVFPSVLIGEHFDAAVDLLQQVQPKQVVTNNTGIAYWAWKMKTPWIAGQYLNLANSFSLKCLQENYKCSGAFISNELSRLQIKLIQKPERFNLYYSIFHPLLLMTSRQCLFHQVSGCSKERVDDQCIQECKRSTTITNLKNETFYIRKEPKYHHCIYNSHNFLNSDITIEIPDKFTSFFIDIRDISTKTVVPEDKLVLIKLFAELLNGTTGANEKIVKLISPVTNSQYRKGF